jgi:hypothetical protein
MEFINHTIDHAGHTGFCIELCWWSFIVLSTSLLIVWTVIYWAVKPRRSSECAPPVGSAIVD